MGVQFLDMATELVELILDEFNDRQTLERVSLVCRRLGEITRHRLISHLPLRSPADCNTFLKSKHRGYLVKDLTIAYTTLFHPTSLLPSNRDPGLAQVLYKALAHLPNVETITIARSIRFRPEFVDNLRPLLSKVHTIALEKWKGGVQENLRRESPAALSGFLKAAPQVKHLRLESANLWHPDAFLFPDTQNEQSGVVEEGPRLESLTLSDGLVGLPARTLRPSNLSSLKVLELGPVGAPKGSALVDLFWLIAGPLEELTLSGPYTGADLYNLSDISSSTAPRLKLTTLRLRVPDNGGPLHRGVTGPLVFLSWAVAFLHFLSQFGRIRIANVKVELEMSNNYKEFSYPQIWQDLGHVLEHISHNGMTPFVEVSTKFAPVILEVNKLRDRERALGELIKVMENEREVEDILETIRLLLSTSSQLESQGMLSITSAETVIRPKGLLERLQTSAWIGIPRPRRSRRRWFENVF